MGCVRSGGVLVVAVAVAVLLLVLTPSSEAQAPLRITLDAPSTCEARIYYNAYLEVDSEPLLVDWRVTGGSAPYEVLINSEPYQGDSGQVSMTCRSLKPDTDVSGPITIQATVTDNAGRRASALADVYALRVYDRGLSKYSQDVLRPGETYRVHQLLLTMPLDQKVYLGNFQSADCEHWGPDCDDRFNIWTTDGYPSSSLWIRRWTGTEYARTLEGEPFVRAEINEDELRYTKRADSRLFDEVLELIGQPPRRYQVTEPRSGPDDPNLKLRLYAPTYCVARGEHFNVLGVDVSWEIAGGRGPYEVTISGQRYLGQTGRAWVPCGPIRRLPDDWEGEPWPVQGTVVDADGRISSNRIDMYALPRPDRWADVENAESPPLPDDFVESNAPLQLTAFFEPAVCEYANYGGSVQLYWTTTGGRSWPLSVTVDGEPADIWRSQTRVRCDTQNTDSVVTLRVAERGADAETTELQLPFISRYADYDNQSYRFTYSTSSALEPLLGLQDGCVTNQQLNLHPPWADGLTLTSDITLYDGIERRSGANDLSCPPLPGWMVVTSTIDSSRGPKRDFNLSHTVKVQQARPERLPE